MDKGLRLIAAHIVVESKMTKSAKLQMLNYIKEQASEAQIKALLMDGKIMKLDEEAEKLVNERFKQCSLNEGAAAVVGAVLVGTYGLMLTGAAVFAYKTLVGVFSEKARRCGVYGVGKSRQICKLRVEAMKNEKLAEFAKKAISACSKTKNPERCTKSNTEAMKKFQAKADKYNSKISNYANKSTRRATKAQKGIEKAETGKTNLT